MFTQVWSKMFVSAASTALMTLAISTAAANAISFNFEGTRLRGSYKIDDAVYNSWISTVSNPQYNEYGAADSTLYRKGGITDFKLFLDGVEVDYFSNLNISELFALNWDTMNKPESHHDYWDVQIPGASQEQKKRFGITIMNNAENNYGRSGRDCLTPGKVCSGEVALMDILLNQNIFENMTHYVSTGLSQNDPWRANQRNGNQSMFENVQSGLWFDAAAADGYEFEASGNSLFTEISSLPGGVDPNQMLTVTVGDRTLGQFRAGDKIDFVSLVGSGVSKFKVTGISAQNGQAVPMKLGFNQETASFKMSSVSGVGNKPPVDNKPPVGNDPKSVPEPTSVIAFLLVGGALILKRQQTNAKSA